MIENLTQGIKYPIIVRLFHYPKQLLFHFITENLYTAHILSLNFLFNVLNITNNIIIPQTIIAKRPHTHAMIVLVPE